MQIIENSKKSAWCNGFINKADLVLATIITLAVLCTFHAALYVFPHNFTLIIWAVIFSLFLTYYRVGVTKLQQICYISAYGILTLVILIISELSALFPNPLCDILRALIIFACLCSPRYLRGGRGISIILVVYVLILFSFAQHE